MSNLSQIINIKNNTASVSVDLHGGAIVDFHLHKDGINPLTFKLSPEEMPANNKAGASYQGHFVCIGRWGPPSPGELKAGLPDHGQAANLLWIDEPSTPKNEILMQVDTPLDGLHVVRVISLDDNNAVFSVREDVKNVNALGGLFNVVQHPTLAKPFLTADTVINCNADKGFNYVLNKKPLDYAAQWPFGVMEDMDTMNVSKPDKAYSSVFSYTVKKGAEFGWITAYTAEHNLLIGYLWKREEYPWISLWQDFDDGNIRYRSLEFGTTGMHKPYKEIIEEGNHHVFDEDSYKYLDAGETQSRSYIAFMCKTPADFTATDHVHFTNGEIAIANKAGRQIIIETSIKL